jgi:hypothetical protein
MANLKLEAYYEELTKLSQETLKKLEEKYSFLNDMPTFKPILLSFIVKVFSKLNGDEVKPFSNHESVANLQDQQRWNKMCTIYETYYQTQVPESWALSGSESDKERRPIFNMSFNMLEQYFHRMSEGIPNQYLLINKSCHEILYFLTEFVKDLRKNKKPFETTWIDMLNGINYREDGVEIMFFVELATWISIRLLNSDPYSKDTLDMIETRIKYCESIRDKVFIYRTSAEIEENCPKYFLNYFIHELKELKVSLAKQVPTTVQLFQNIDSLITDGLIGKTFKWMYYLMNDIPKEAFLVHRPLGKFPAKPEETRFFKNNILGQWISSTLNFMGVTNNQYLLAAKKLELASINSFVENNTTLLYKIDRLPYGLHACLHDNSAHYMERLNMVIASMLKVAYVYQQFSALNEVTVKHGISAINKNQKGCELLKLLNTAINESISELEANIKYVWAELFEQDFMLSGERNASKNEKSAKTLDDAKLFIIEIGGVVELIKTNLSKINSLNTKEKIEEFSRESELKLQKIIQNLNIYFNYANIPNKIVSDEEEKKQDDVNLVVAIAAAADALEQKQETDNIGVGKVSIFQQAQTVSSKEASIRQSM